jgi:hypothetical protein
MSAINVVNGAGVTMMTALSLFISWDTWVRTFPSSPHKAAVQAAAPAEPASYAPATNAATAQESVANGCRRTRYGCYVLSGTDELWLREKPNEYGRPLMKIPSHGAVLRGTGRPFVSPEGWTWLPVRLGNDVGWVSASYVEMIRD